MSTIKTTSLKKNTRDERGDPSVKALKITIAVCLVGLIGVYLFAFAPKPGPKTTTSLRTANAGTTTKAKEPVAKFDRESLSTKDR